MRGKKQAESTGDSNELYIPLYEPKGLRGEILSTAISSLEVMRLAEAYKQRQREKMLLQAKFRAIMGKISDLSSRLIKEYLPPVSEPKRLEKKMGLQVASPKVETAKKPRKVQAEKKEDLVPVRDNLGREIEELKRMLSNL